MSKFERIIITIILAVCGICGIVLFAVTPNAEPNETINTNATWESWE